MLTLAQGAELLGLNRVTSAKAMADILGIWPDFSLRQILGLITNGRVPRPFYVVGHNTNSIGEIEAALAVGANAVEIDVNVYEDRQDTLCVSEAGGLDSDEGGAPGAPDVQQFLTQLRAVADSNPENLALVIFDCKPKAATADLGRRILDLARSSFSDTGLNIIMSVASFDNRGIFDQVRDDLRDREGLMIDEENEPSAVLQFFDGVAHPCYGNGIAAAFQSPTLSPHVRPSIERACAIRTSFGKLKFVYTWTIGEEDDLREYIRIGANGIIPGEVAEQFRCGDDIETARDNVGTGIPAHRANCQPLRQPIQTSGNRVFAARAHGRRSQCRHGCEC